MGDINGPRDGSARIREYRAMINVVGQYAARLYTFLAILLVTGAHGSENLLELADKAAQDGRLDDMQTAYEQILQGEPGNVRALVGRAAAEAWQGNYEAAQTTYLRAIAIEPNNVDAIVGLGYAHAWNAEYTKAHTRFHAAIKIAPENNSARKGIAYSYYWDGQLELALESFDIAQSVASNDAEIAEASGRVNLSLGRSRDALLHLDRALQIDPTRTSARLAKRSAYSNAPALELNLRTGSTSGGGSGLRALEVAHWLSLTTRVAVRYDNTLGLDNPGISRRGEDAPGYFGSVQQKLGERWLTAIEIGRMVLADGDQNIIMAQASYLSSFGVVRAGTRLGHYSGGQTDKLLFAGVNFPLGSRWRVEPTFYLSQTGATDDNEWRSVVNVEYQAQPDWKVGVFVGAGKIDAADPTFDGQTATAGLWGSMLIADRHTLQLSVRREETPTVNLSIVELGFIFRLPRN